jgi:hypothetical protein
LSLPRSQGRDKVFDVQAGWEVRKPAVPMVPIGWHTGEVVVRSLHLLPDDILPGHAQDHRHVEQRAGVVEAHGLDAVIMRADDGNRVV